MGPSKRQFFYEHDTENGNSPKRHGWERTFCTASQSETLIGSLMDLDSISPQDNIAPETTIRVENHGNERICYGTICEVHVLLTSNTKMPKETQPWDRYYLLDVEIQPKACYLAPEINSKSKQRSFIDDHTGLILNYVMNKVPHVSFSAVIAADALYGKGSKLKVATIKATINIHGPERMMGEVDQVLSEVSLDLQHPVFLEPEVVYINPQFFYPTAEKTDLRHLVGPAPEDATSDKSRAITGVMESLDDCPENISTKGCPRDYLQTIFDGYLHKTTLKGHQLQGVEFILGREEPETANDMNKRMLMSIDASLLSKPNRPGLGGILADVMGLGKTITMLGAILCSKHLKKQSSINEATRSEDLEGRSNLTLILLPSRQLLDIWKNEIDRRFRPRTFQVEIFHGQARCRDVDRLVESDIVLTTYHTLEKDSNVDKILTSIKWSRIVLDEAHHIRNPSTKIHRATVALESKTRWCLTGTPIQNSLDDLRTLLSFLRFEPFCQGKTFEEYIVKPLRLDWNEGHQGLNPSRNLRALLQACCIRRTQLKLNLPETDIRTIGVAPAEAEKAMFNKILVDCRDQFDRMGGKEAGSKKSNLLFSSIMKLRRVCNHGLNEIKLPTPRQSNYLAVPRLKHNTSRSPSVDPACEFCSKDVLEDDLLGALDSCPLCSRILTEERFNSPSAELSPQRTPSPAVSRMDVDSSAQFNDKSDFSPSGDSLRSQSSKMSAVIDNIKTSCLDESSKSVVLSSWRDTLDILAKMLTFEGIRFLQVDGRNPLLGRTELLSTFRQDPLVKVLLISINTGAVGLTLTEANKVHIIEPQWNPTIEEQAIARVVRMGQTRPVTVFKYIMEGSVEQSIVKLQERKTRIIKLSMQDKDANESDANLDRFKFTLDPNEWKANL